MNTDEARALAAELLRAADEAELPELRAVAKTNAAEAFLRDADAAIATADSIRATIIMRRRLHASTTDWSEQRSISAVLEELSRLDGFLEIDPDA